MAARKTGGLGRGLDALIPTKTPVEKAAVKKSNTEQETKEKSEEKKQVSSELKVKISSVEPNRSQPRKKFDEDSLLELAESIKQYGVIQPLLVSDKKDYYEIIAGERRWRAAKMAGIKEIPIIIKELTD